MIMQETPLELSVGLSAIYWYRGTWHTFLDDRCNGTGLEDFSRE